MIRSCFLLHLLQLTVCLPLAVWAFPVVCLLTKRTATSKSYPALYETVSSPCCYSSVVVRRGGLRLSSRDDENDEGDDFARVPRRRRRGRFYDEEDEEDAFYDAVERKIYGENEGSDDGDDWEEEEEDDDDNEDEDLGLFSNVLIDNPILDSIDPDGAAERFPELARDPRFWFDMVLFITFLDLISAIGPQNTFPDIPFYV